MEQLKALLLLLDLGGSVRKLVMTLLGGEEEEEEERVVEAVAQRVEGRRAVKRRKCWSPEPERRKRKKITDNIGQIDGDAEPDIEGSTCSLCGTVCSSNHWLKVHLTTQHFNDEIVALVNPVECDLCELKFPATNIAKYRSIVHRGVVHGAVVSLYHARCLLLVLSCRFHIFFIRKKELLEQRRCKLCDSHAPLDISPDSVPLQLSDGQVPPSSPPLQATLSGS